MLFKFGIIWPHRLQDYNIFVLKKNAQLFLAIHLEVKINSQPTQMKKFYIMKRFKTTVQTYWWKNIIQMIHWVCKMTLRCQKVAKKSSKKTYLRLNLVRLKGTLDEGNTIHQHAVSKYQFILDWFGILPHNLEEKTHILQQDFLNLEIGCKSYSTSSWTSRICGYTFGSLKCLGVNRVNFIYF